MSVTVSTDAPSYGRLFATLGFPRLVASMLLARAAGQMVALILVLLALQRYGSAELAGLVTFLAVAPGIVASPIAGLGTSHVDLLQLHNLVDQTEWDTAMGPDGALRAAVEARDAGLVRFIGVTGHGLRAPAQHRCSLERFPFDSVLFPYNCVQLRDAGYAADIATLMRACEERSVAMQTIKAITLGPWHAERPATPTTWYEPLHDERDIALAVRWVLGEPRLFLNTVGDVGILPLVLDAASRAGPRPTNAEMDDLLTRREMSPLFVS